MSLKNILLSAFFSPLVPQPLPKNPSFLIVSTTGLGDTLWGIPAIRLLRKNYPSSHIALLTTPLGKALLQEEKSINETILLAHPLSLIRSYRRRFDLIFFFHASQRMTIPLCRLLAPKWMVGTKGMQKGLDHLFSHIHPWDLPHEAQRRVELLSVLGIKPTTLDFSFSLSSQEKNRGRKLLSDYKKPLILLHPGAKDGYKCWPVDAYLALARKIEENSLGTPIFTRAPADPKIPSNYKSFENLPIREYASLLNAADLLVTNDTGPMHLMSGLKKPLIALFGPTDPKVCGPLSSKAVVLQAHRCCTPCRKRKCLDPFCLREISVERVLKEIENILYCRDLPLMEYSPLCTLSLLS